MSDELLSTALRALVVYGVVLVVIRVLGKRTIGNFTPFDLLVALMLGEVVDEIIYADVTLTQGLVAIGTIALAQYANSWMSYWDHGLAKLLEGSPSPLVRDGVLQKAAMRRERMNEKEVMAELRLQGIEDLRELKLAMVESNGAISVIRHEWAEAAQKADLIEKHAASRDEETDDEAEPPPRQRTTAARHRH
jgi:uncharacterized membrane protein YcaP (DUF421 family)